MHIRVFSVSIYERSHLDSEWAKKTRKILEQKKARVSTKAWYLAFPCYHCARVVLYQEAARGGLHPSR